MTQPRIHGGTDALGVPQHDFSTNSNACGPCPQALLAVQQADASHYPDASYTELRAQLAAFHQVDAGRIVLAGSASEFIFRITACVARGVGRAEGSGALHWPDPLLRPAVQLPPHAYGDYAQAAQAWGLPRVALSAEAALVWACEPSSPLGQAHVEWPAWLSATKPSTSAEWPDGPSSEVSGPDSMAACVPISVPHGLPICVLDCAYAPLRLSGVSSLSAAQRNQLWQLFTPNKALGLTGVRAAYVIAPCAMNVSVQGQIDATVLELNQLAPSWPVGAHGVAMLQAWASPAVQAWLAVCVPVLRGWKARQVMMLESLEWTVQPSEANFFCAKPPKPLDLTALRADHGIKLRDCASFGLPGHVRVGVLPPQAQDALAQALQGD
ncbi:MAG: aminotransferase class I/II-fold pyridoxal phosphate-dependent enzyme [Rhodoferax sp.]|uniref:aminotransferase class I/II-fold pyridoxal phosphate-dependent enzyme n=1 Tax=Rhodoferax sp. TaxID=50421 RepID=UPI00262C8C3D|nr:aminotransferase class I/II-fold pyridoxal phosphate-dependent enzyme [Rhodoferax sp.]MDD2881412.1 aminotransferase class I/II-fold pyridoxal phosphate-dependent enzyme [Rhodoferax sp.]